MYQSESRPIGQVAYETYADQFYNTTYDGKFMPHWDDLTDVERSAWTEVYLRCWHGLERSETNG